MQNVIEPAEREQKLKVSDITRAYGVSRTTVERWIAAGLLEVERLGPRSLRIPVSSWRKFLASRNKAPTETEKPVGVEAGPPSGGICEADVPPYV